MRSPILTINVSIFLLTLVASVYVLRNIKREPDASDSRDPIFRASKSHLKLFIYLFSLSITGLAKTFSGDYFYMRLMLIGKDNLEAMSKLPTIFSSLLVTVFCGTLVSEFAKSQHRLQYLIAALLGIGNAIQLSLLIK